MSRRFLLYMILIEQYPNMIHAYTALTLQYVQAGKLEEAFAQTETALAFFPSETQNSTMQPC